MPSCTPSGRYFLRNKAVGREVKPVGELTACVLFKTGYRASASIRPLQFAVRTASGQRITSAAGHKFRTAKAKYHEFLLLLALQTDSDAGAPVRAIGATTQCV